MIVQHLIQLVTGIWSTLLAMAPFLMFGFFLAGVLSVVLSAETVERHLGKGRFLPVLKAALFGIPLPLCSCGVLPVAASLRRHGASRGATTAFLLATPQTGVDSMFVTYSLLGLTFAIFTPFAALVSGILAGVLVTLLHAKDKVEVPLVVEEEDCSCCHGEKKKPAIQRILHHGYVVLARDIAQPLFIGLLIAGAIAAFVPENAFAGRMGSGFSAKLVMLAAGIPLYVCATASIPIAASLILAGLSPGAALVFLMSGPATNAATITTIWKLMGPKTALAYLFAVAVAALSAGSLLDMIYTSTGVTAAPAEHDMLPTPLRVALALALIGTLLWARYGDRLRGTKAHGDDGG